MSSTFSHSVATAFDAVAETYDEHYSTRADLAESAFVFGMAQTADPGHGVFYDLGCGPGTALRWMDVSPSRYLGVDISKLMVEQAQDKWASAGYRFMTGSEESLIPGSAGFILGGFAPLQHVEHLELFAGYVYDALAPGGRFQLMGRPGQAKTRVLGSDALTRPYSAADVEAAWWWCEDLEIRGLRYHVPGWLPARVQIALMARTAFFSPDRHEWLIVSGSR